MKKITFTFLLAVLSISMSAQIPNFGTTIGDQKLYGYSSMKYRVLADTWETYSTLQYGIGNHFQCGADLYTNGSTAYLGYVVRGGVKLADFFKIGAQLTPSFDLGDNHKFGYLTSAIYINGDLSNDGNLFYVADTWFENDRERLRSAMQWAYLGYHFNLGKRGNGITPMVGAIYSWEFDRPVDLSIGCYYTYKNINFYAWANDVLTNHPRFVLAIEFSFSNK